MWSRPGIRRNDDRSDACDASRHHNDAYGVVAGSGGDDIQGVRSRRARYVAGSMALSGLGPAGMGWVVRAALNRGAAKDGRVLGLVLTTP